MAEITDLHILAKMSEGTPNKEDAFNIKDEEGNVLYQVHNLEELVEVLGKISPERLFPHLYRPVGKEGEFECDLALWVHYVLGDATLSAKIFHFVKNFHEKPKKLHLKILNLCFNRYLNFKEVLNRPDFPFEEDEYPSSSHL
ncbi:MAG: hypothetical protein GF308_16390 [Candidatus Heimdallarchaeota archaeon]|nr:hypothetical protein [Candidatus Heimdallarchaeota archaeon]